MSRVTSRHFDDLELLCYNAGDLSEAENVVVLRHLEQCDRCLLSSTELRSLDAAVREATRGERARSRDRDLSPNDPFHERPARAFRSVRLTRELSARALESSQRGADEVESFLAAAGGPPQALQRFLEALNFADPADRYLLLYGLDEAGRRLPDAPGRFLRLADAALDRLGALGAEDAGRESPPADAETLVPLGTLVAQARTLAGQAAVWTGELEKARRHFEECYRSFRWDGEGDEARLAMIELHESRRRSFAGLPAQGLALARRARTTFDRFGMFDYSAQTLVAEGIALSALGRDEDALACYRIALPVFQSQGLWTNYCSSVNRLAFSLARRGRLDEVRREFLRALRTVSRDPYPSLLAFCRQGLARVLFIGGRYENSGNSFAQVAGLFQELGQTGDVLSAQLWEIESWAERRSRACPASPGDLPRLDGAGRGARSLHSPAAREGPRPT